MLYPEVDLSDVNRIEVVVGIVGMSSLRMVADGHEWT